MADLFVKKFGMINPFVIASSPATQGAANLLKSAASRPGALVLRNFGHVHPWSHLRTVRTG